jgi:hypothetical protein
MIESYHVMQDGEGGARILGTRISSDQTGGQRTKTETSAGLYCLHLGWLRGRVMRPEVFLQVVATRWRFDVERYRFGAERPL